MRRHGFPGQASALRAIHQPAGLDAASDRKNESALHLQRIPFASSWSCSSSAILSAAAAGSIATASATTSAWPSTAACRSALSAEQDARFQRDRQRPELAADHAAPAAGRSGQRQDHRGLPGAAAGQGERLPGGVPGPDRDPGRPALPERLRFFRRRRPGPAHRRLRPPKPGNEIQARPAHAATSPWSSAPMP